MIDEESSLVKVEIKHSFVPTYANVSKSEPVIITKGSVIPLPPLCWEKLCAELIYVLLTYLIYYLYYKRT